MKIYLAGTPGIASRERVAKVFKKQTFELLGYFSGSVFSTFCIQLN